MMSGCVSRRVESGSGETSGTGRVREEGRISWRKVIVVGKGRMVW